MGVNANGRVSSVRRQRDEGQMKDEYPHIGSARMDEENVNGAVAYIQSSVEVPEAGAVYRGCLVKSVKDFGCFVEILPGKEALCHISELSAGHTKKVTDVCDVGDVIDVKVLELRDNKVRVSKRAADAETAGALDS